MSTFIAMISMFQFNATLVLEYNSNSLFFMNNPQQIWMVMDYWADSRANLSISNKVKINWLKDMKSEKNREEVNIISEWIIPVTVTAGIGGLVYAVYHYRGR